MTAEIAILNKHGVALAADSAVTLSSARTPKVYNSANKLFMLSKYHPVGVMVYGSAYLMGVPWETVIKDYREELADTDFEKLKEFAEAFLNHLEVTTRLFPSSLQLSELRGLVNWFLLGIRNELDEVVKSKISSSGGITEQKFNNS